MLKRKYIVLFLKRENNSYTVSKTVRVKAGKTEIRFEKGNTQEIDTTKPNYSKGLKSFIFVDINENNGGQVYFKGMDKSKLNAKMRDMLLSEKIIDQLSTNLHQISFKQRLIDIVIGGAIGGLIGYIVAGGMA